MRIRRRSQVIIETLIVHADAGDSDLLRLINPDHPEYEDWTLEWHRLYKFKLSRRCALSDEAHNVLMLARHHSNAWRGRRQLKWVLGLCEEVIELLLSLCGLHKGPPDWELQQIAAIAMNWLEMRNISHQSDS